MVKVKIINSCVINKKHVKEGAEVSVSKADAATLIGAKRAVLATKKADK